MKKYICGITLLLALALMTGCSNEKYNEDGVLDNTDTEIVDENTDVNEENENKDEVKEENKENAPVVKEEEKTEVVKN